VGWGLEGGWGGGRGKVMGVEVGEGGRTVGAGVVAEVME